MSMLSIRAIATAVAASAVAVFAIACAQIIGADFDPREAPSSSASSGSLTTGSSSSGGGGGGGSCTYDAGTCDADAGAQKDCGYCGHDCLESSCDPTVNRCGAKFVGAAASGWLVNHVVVNQGWVAFASNQTDGGYNLFAVPKTADNVPFATALPNQPVPLLVGDRLFAGDLGVNDSLFAFDLLTQSLSAASPQSLLPLRGIANDGPNLYLLFETASYVDTVERVPMSNLSAMPQPISAPMPNGAAVVAGSGRVFWAARGSGEQQGTVFVYDEKTTQRTMLAEEPSGNEIARVATDGSFVYWSSHLGVSRAPLDAIPSPTPTPTLLLPRNTTGDAAIAVDGFAVYVADSQTGIVWEVPIPCEQIGAPRILFAADGAPITDELMPTIAIDDAYVYFAIRHQVYRVAK